NLIPNDSASSISNDSISSTSNNSASNIPNDSTSSIPNNSISSISNDSTSSTLNNSISSIPNNFTSSTPNNSASKMFEKYLHLYLAIQKMSYKEQSVLTCLDNESLIVLKTFRQFLKPFKIATSVLSEKQSNSISDALTVILEIDQHIHKFRDNNINVNNILMTKKFDKYWKSILDHIIIAHVLDPKYKLKHLKATLIEVGEYNNSDAKIFVNDIHKKVISYGTKYSSTSSSNYVEIDNNDNSTEPLGDLDIRIKLWESLSSRFPILSKMVRDFLSIKPSSVSSERAFSRAGFTITNDRASICEKTVSSTILIHS
ncbi:11497_t:CDS:2, partial [Dentiscutata heterogama]